MYIRIYTYIHIHIHIECTDITINITKDYCHRIITVVVSRHYYRCNKFYCLITLFVCRVKRVQDRTKIQLVERYDTSVNDVLVYKARKKSCFRSAMIILEIKNRVLCRKRDQGQSVPVRSDFSSNSKAFLVYEPMLFSNCRSRSMFE